MQKFPKFSSYILSNITGHFQGYNKDVIFLLKSSQVRWGCRIHWLHLFRGVRHTLINECLGYDIKPSDGEAPALKIWGMCSTPSLPLLPGPLWPRGITPHGVLSMSQIEQTMCANKWLMLNCDCYLAILETICVQKRAQTCWRMLSTKCVYKSYICLIYMYKDDLALNNLQ